MTRPLPTLLLLAAAAGLLLLAGQSGRQAAAARSSLAAVVQKSARLRPRLDQARHQADYAARSKALLRARLAGLQAHPLPAPSRSTTPEVPSFATQLVTDPKLFALYREAFRASLGVRSSGQYQALQLTPSQIDAFEELATDHEAEIQELRATAQAQGLPMNDPDIAAVRQQENEDFQAAVTAATGLSEAQVVQIKQGDFPGRLQPLQGPIRTIERYAASADGAPLTFQQQQQLTLAAAAASRSYREGGAADPQTIDWGAMITQSRGFLSPFQIQAVQRTAQMDQLVAMVTQFNARPTTPR